MMTKTTTVYRSLLRPVRSTTLPSGIGWEYVEVPSDIAHARPDMPVSDWIYGTFTTGRPLTADEMRHFDIEEVA